MRSHRPKPAESRTQNLRGARLGHVNRQIMKTRFTARSATNPCERQKREEFDVLFGESNQSHAQFDRGSLVLVEPRGAQVGAILTCKLVLSRFLAFHRQIVTFLKMDDLFKIPLGHGGHVGWGRASTTRTHVVTWVQHGA